MNKRVLGLIWAGLTIAAYGEESVDLGKSVVYSTTGFATEMRKTASTPTVVTSKEIEEKNYKTVSEVLDSIPSINVVKQGKDSIIDLRGQGDKAKQNVQILVDGVQINSLDTSMTATPIDTISPDSIERIEVIPGGGSVLYGSGTSGGVVNIITKKGSGRKAMVGFDYGEYGSKKTNVAVGESFGNFDINLAYTKNDRKGYRDNDESDSDYFQGDLGYRISDTQNINFKYSKYKADEDYPKMLSKKEVEEDRKQDGLTRSKWGTGINGTETDKDEYVLTYNNKLSESLDFNLTGFYQNTEMKIRTWDFGAINTGTMKGQAIADQRGLFEDEKWGVKPKFRYSYGEGSSLIFGMDYIQNKAKRVSDMRIQPIKAATGGLSPMSIKSITTNNLEKETISGYVMNNYVWGDFEFAQGLRYEKANYEADRNTNRVVSMNGSPMQTNNEGRKVTTDEDNFAYELSANYLYSDTGKAYVRYERGFTSPPPALLTNKVTTNGLANYYLNDLNSEKYDNFEIGFSDYIGFSNVSGSVFYTVTKDEITQDMASGMPPAWIYNYNLGKTDRVGFELKAEQYLGKLTLSQSYSFINAKIKDGKKGVYDKDGNKTGYVDLEGNRVAKVPKNKFNIGANYAFTDNFNLGAEVVYVDKIYLNNENLGGKVNSHIVTNIRANYNFNSGLTLYAGINNIFNEQYYEAVDYSLSEGYTYDPAAERNYYVGFKYSL